jgi:hypothetical protein
MAFQVSKLVDNTYMIFNDQTGEHWTAVDADEVGSSIDGYNKTQQDKRDAAKAAAEAANAPLVNPGIPVDDPTQEVPSEPVAVPELPNKFDPQTGLPVGEPEPALSEPEVLPVTNQD